MATQATLTEATRFFLMNIFPKAVPMIQDTLKFLLSVLAAMDKM